MICSKKALQLPGVFSVFEMSKSWIITKAARLKSDPSQTQWLSRQIDALALIGSGDLTAALGGQRGVFLDRS